MCVFCTFEKLTFLPLLSFFSLSYVYVNSICVCVCVFGIKGESSRFSFRSCLNENYASRRRMKRSGRISHVRILFNVVNNLKNMSHNWEIPLVKPRRKNPKVKPWDHLISVNMANGISSWNFSISVGNIMWETNGEREDFALNVFIPGFGRAGNNITNSGGFSLRCVDENSIDWTTNNSQLSSMWTNRSRRVKIYNPIE